MEPNKMEPQGSPARSGDVTLDNLTCPSTPLRGIKPETEVETEVRATQSAPPTGDRLGGAHQGRDPGVLNDEDGMQEGARNGADDSETGAISSAHGINDQGTATNGSGSQSSSHSGGTANGSHEDDGGITVTAENAQSIYPPAACVFVGNLDKARTRAELVEEITKLFKSAGRCWVKVRWGPQNMPYSFVQFQDVEAANMAENTMHGMEIFGRPCRIERARAQRTVFCSRKDQQYVALPSIFNKLRPFGQIERCWFLNREESRRYNLPDGVFVRFALFQPCQEAVRALRNDPVHNYDMQLTRLQSYAPVQGPGRSGFVPNAVIVENLPYNVDEGILEGIFRSCGKITSIMLCRNTNKTDAHAFIHFANAEFARNAVQCPGTLRIGNFVVRIEPKRVRTVAPEYAPGATSLSSWRPLQHQRAGSVAASTPRHVPNPFFGPMRYPFI